MVPSRIPLPCRPVLVTVLTGALLLFASCEPPVPRERDLLIATATTGGTFYPVGVALATLMTQTLGDEEQVLASAITSSGSAENVSLLENDEVQLAILQALFGSMAWQGSGVYEGRPVRDLRGITMLWDNVEQVVVIRRFAETGTVDDLAGMAGQRVSLGSRWSGTEVSARTILTALGLEPGRTFDVMHLGYGPSANALQNRRIAGMFLAGGIPTGAVTQAMAALGPDNIAFLEFTDDHLERLRDQYPVWRRFVIPEETYPGQREPVRTLAQPNLLATTTQVDDDVVYLVLRTLWENLDFIQRQHAATREMKLETALDGLPLPLHPGAVRFYREAGVDVPDALLPPEMIREGDS